MPMQLGSERRISRGRRDPEGCPLRSQRRTRRTAIAGPYRGNVAGQQLTVTKSGAWSRRCPSAYPGGGSCPAVTPSLEVSRFPCRVAGPSHKRRWRTEAKGLDRAGAGRSSRHVAQSEGPEYAAGPHWNTKRQVIIQYTLRLGLPERPRPRAPATVNPAVRLRFPRAELQVDPAPSISRHGIGRP